MESLEKQKKGKGHIVVIILLLLIILGLVGYILLDKEIILKDSFRKVEEKERAEEKAEREEVKKEDLDINSVLVQRLFSVFRLDRDCWMRADALNEKNYVRLRLAYDQMKNVNIDSVKCSDVGAEYNRSYCGNGSRYWSTNMQQAFNSGNYSKFIELVNQEGYTDSFAADKLKLSYQYLFGTDATYKDESFGLGHTAEPICAIMKYDDNKKIYAEYSCEGGGTCGGDKQELLSAYKEGNSLFLKTKLTEEVDPNNIKESTVTYEFKYDKDVVNYVFVKTITE